MIGNRWDAEQLESFVYELEQLQHKPLLAASPPRNDTLTLAAATEAAGRKELADCYEHALRVLRERLQEQAIPIIGVLGQLNAGKSSVVASFLSPAGRQRLPRGLESQYGTHRFVYWLPQAWKNDPAIRQSVAQLLAHIHGQAPEPLSDNPDEAAAQYRSGEKRPETIPVPLVAYDPGLQTIGLLDCLDVQTKDAPDAPARQQRIEINQRLEFVAQAARICSAFWVVWQQDTVRDRLFEAFLGRIRQVMSDVPLYLLINKIRPNPSQPAAIYNEENIQTAIKKYHIAGVYGAFDFDIPGWQDRTPPGLARMMADQRLPCFYRFSRKYLNTPQNVPDSEWLPNLYRELEPSQLYQQIIASHRREIGEQGRACHQAITLWMDAAERNTQKAYEGLLRFCNKLFADERNEPIQIHDPQFFNTLNHLILGQAPWYVQLANLFMEYVQEGIRRVRNAVTSRMPLATLRKQIRQETGVHAFAWDAESLAQEIQDRRFIPQEWDTDGLSKTWSTILQHFQRHFHLKPDSEVMQQMAEDIWRQQGAAIKWKSLLGTLGCVVGVGGLFTAIVDGGATMLAGFSMAGSLAAALPGTTALTVGILGTGTALATFYKGLIEQNSLPALAAMFEICCDAFGLPRQLPGVKRQVEFGLGQQRRTFELPAIGMPALPPVRPLPNCGLWKWTAEGRRWADLIGTG